MSPQIKLEPKVSIDTTKYHGWNFKECMIHHATKFGFKYFMVWVNDIEITPGQAPTHIDKLQYIEMAPLYQYEI